MTKISQPQPIIDFCLPIRVLIGQNLIPYFLCFLLLTKVRFAFCHSVT